MHSKSNVTFSGDNVISNQLANKTGNLSQLLFKQNEQSVKSENVDTLPSLLEKSNPFNWNSKSFDTPDGEQGRFQMFLNQARMSTYFQDHPWDTLEHAKKFGYQGNQLGGNIRGELPPGYLPGNTIKPNNNVKSLMSNNNGTIEGFENASVSWN